MKEITSLNANFINRTPNEGEEFIPEIEVALILSEVVYRLGVTGEVQKDRACETVRFVATAENLRKLAKTFTRYAEEAETALSEALRENADAALKAELARRKVSSQTYIASAPTPPPAEPAP
jgi:hypothetical protein